MNAVVFNRARFHSTHHYLKAHVDFRYGIVNGLKQLDVLHYFTGKICILTSYKTSQSLVGTL